MFLSKFKINKHNLGIILLILSLFYLLITTCEGFLKPGLWYDELYSIYMVKLPLSQMYVTGTTDVHPLLYYLIFKFFKKIAFFFNFNDIIAIGVFVSLLPIYLLYLFNIMKIRKEFGLLTCGIFALLFTSMPRLMWFSTDLRMYSWGLLFITLSYFYIFQILQKSTLKSWIILTILTICSSYTHYYAALTSIVLYLILLIILFKQNKALLKNWLVSCLICVVSYTFWITFLFKQFTRVNDHWWVDSFSIERVISCIFYIFSPEQSLILANEFQSPTILGILLLISVVILILNHKNDFNSKFAIMGIIIFVIVFSFGIIYSFVKSPIFHARYSVLLLGMFWLAISILLAKNYSKKIFFIPILCIMLICGVVGAISFDNMEEIGVEHTQNNITASEEIFGVDNIVYLNPNLFAFTLFSSFDFQTVHYNYWLFLHTDSKCQ